MKTNKRQRRTVSPRISEQTEGEITNTFKNLTGGAKYILEAWPGLYRKTLYDLKRRFSRGELMLMIDVMNGTFLTAGIAGQQIGLNVNDGINLDGLDKKWKIDKNELLNKINNLSIFEAACLEIWIRAFWGTKSLNAEEYVKDMKSDN